jgi:hypothetical protein
VSGWFEAGMISGNPDVIEELLTAYTERELAA